MPNWKMPTAAMPRPPGQNPYRVKGHGLRARMAIYDRVVPGGSAAVLAALDDPAVRDYLSAPILAASWYDLFAHAALDRAAAGLRRMPAWESVASASAIQAKSDASGIYSLLLRLVSPHTLVRKLGAISAQYFDHGKIDAVKLEDRAARLTYGGIANQLYWWWTGIGEGYVRALFQIAGAKNARVHTSALRSEAMNDPLGAGTFEFDVHWD